MIGVDPARARPPQAGRERACGHDPPAVRADADAVDRAELTDEPTSSRRCPDRRGSPGLRRWSRACPQPRRRATVESSRPLDGITCISGSGSGSQLRSVPSVLTVRIRAPVRRPAHAGNGTEVPAQDDRKLAQADLPDADRAVAAGRRDESATGVERHRGHLARVADHWPTNLPLGGPEPAGAVVAPRGDQLSVGTERDRVDVALVAADHLQRLARLRRPEAKSPVTVAGGDHLAVRAARDRLDRAPWQELPGDAKRALRAVPESVRCSETRRTPRMRDASIAWLSTSCVCPVRSVLAASRASSRLSCGSTSSWCGASASKARGVRVAALVARVGALAERVDRDRRHRRQRHECDQSRSPRDARWRRAAARRSRSSSCSRRQASTARRGRRGRSRTARRSASAPSTVRTIRSRPSVESTGSSRSLVDRGVLREVAGVVRDLRARRCHEEPKDVCGDVPLAPSVSSSTARWRCARTIDSAPPEQPSVCARRRVRSCPSLLVPDPLEHELEVRRLDPPLVRSPRPQARDPRRRDRPFRPRSGRARRFDQLGLDLDRLAARPRCSARPASRLPRAPSADRDGRAEGSSRTGSGYAP